MAFGTYLGYLSWSLDRDDLGYRSYTLTGLVYCPNTTDGPAGALFATGAPSVGSTWTFGTVLDPWVWCRPEARVMQWQTNPGEPSHYFTLEQKFSNKPFTARRRNSCRNQSFDDPLAEPPLVSGGSNRYTEEKRFDKDGNLIMTSSFEYVQGPMAEFDENRSTVHIEQNVASLNLDTANGMRDKVNDSTLWGHAARTVKLSSVQWQRKLYGTCGFYYTRVFDFDINPNTFDRTIPDISNYCLRGRWKDDGAGGFTWEEARSWTTAERKNPLNYIRMLDPHNNPISGLLNGNGSRVLTEVNPDAVPHIPLDPVKVYKEANFLSLGIPSTL